MLLVYSVENKLPEPKICDSEINVGGKPTAMHSNLYLEANKKYDFKFYLPYPKDDIKAKLSLKCKKKFQILHSFNKGTNSISHPLVFFLLSKLNEDFIICIFSRVIIQKLTNPYDIIEK